MKRARFSPDDESRSKGRSQLPLFNAEPAPPTSGRTEPLLTKAEAAERLNVSVRFINRIVAEHRIRYVHIGRHIRIPESAVADFITAGTVVARP